MALADAALLAFLDCLRGAQHLLRAIERAVLGLAASRAVSAVARRPAWFDGHSQPIESSATNTVDEDAAAWAGPKTYTYGSVRPELAFPDVTDTTEGIASAAELHRMGRIGRADLVLDLGSGRFCRSGAWLRLRGGAAAVHAADPYNLPPHANAASQRAVEAAGGADVVLSASVVNVLPTARARLEHYALARRALKPGGRAYFFVWAGDWPLRGTGRATVDAARGAYQANAWASAFVDEVAAVFGRRECYADNGRSFVCARRPHSAEPVGGGGGRKER